MNSYLFGLQNVKVIQKYPFNIFKNQFFISSMTSCLKRNICLKISPVFRSNSNLMKDSYLKTIYTYVSPKNVKPIQHYSEKKFFSTSKFNCIFERNGRVKSQVGSKSTLNYVVAIGVLTIGLSYAAVPLYRIFCQAYSYGGTTSTADPSAAVESMVLRDDREITIRFTADISASMTWNFKPQQVEIKVRPGETALAFYSARNSTNKPVIGISTYNVLPFEAGQYFNKIQCFCFEEQMLNPNEEVSMPVFFYVDPEFADDPIMEKVDEIILSYTFFEVKEGQKLPIPNFMRK